MHAVIPSDGFPKQGVAAQDELAQESRFLNNLIAKAAPAISIILSGRHHAQNYFGDFLDQQGDDSKNKCGDAWGSGLIWRLKNSSQNVTHDGVNFTVMGAPRSQAPSATGSVAMAVFKLDDNNNASELSISDEVSLRQNLARPVDVVKQWRSECSSNPPKTQKLLIMLRSGASSSEMLLGNVWHTMAALFPVWLSSVLLGMDTGSVDLLWPEDVHNSGASQAIVTLDVITNKPRLDSHAFVGEKMCSYSALTLPLADGFLWDLAWDQSFECTPDDGRLVRDFSNQVMTAMNIEWPASYASTNAEVCIMHRHPGEKRTLNNEDEVKIALDSLKYRGKPVHIKILNFSHQVPFQRQILQTSTCDVLLGPHGGGMTHLLWLKPGSDVVEILPSKTSGEVSDYMYFRNLAMLTGVHYFAVKGYDAEFDWKNPSQVHPLTPEVVKTVTRALEALSGRNE